MRKFSIFNLVFPSRYLMASSLLRFQEHYESPKFRGKNFSLEEYMDWYARERGCFSYFEDWSGFNFPGHILHTFYERNDLGAKETVVYQETRKALDLSWAKEYYVIGTEGKGSTAISHELVHALFYLNHDYASKVKRLCRHHASALAPFWAWLESIGYHKKVWDDETNAYLVTGFPRGIPVTPKLLPVKEFKALFQEMHDFSIKDLSDPTWIKSHIHQLDMGPKLRRLRYNGHEKGAIR